MWRGLFWSGFNVFANKGVGIFARLVLALWLAPASFGLVAMVLVFLNLLGLFVDFGLQNVLVQRPRDERSAERYYSVFWFLLVAGFGWMLAFAAVFSSLTVWVFNEARLAEIALLLAPCLLFQSIAVLPEVRLLRRMRFRSIAAAEVASTLSSAVAAIAIAFAGAGVFSLIAQQLIYTALRAVFIWHASNWRPRLHFSWRSLREVQELGGYMLGSRVLTYLGSNIDRLAIGAILGASSLGLYTISYTITENIRAQLSRVISRVMLPVYARMQENFEGIKGHYLSITRVMTLVFFPFLLSLVLFAEPIIELIFSEEWSEATLPTQLLAAGGMMVAISGPAVEVLVGIGRAREVFVISVLNLVMITIPAIWVLTMAYDLVGSATAMLISFSSMRVFCYFALRRYLSIALVDILRATGPAVCAAGSLCAINWIVETVSPIAGISVIASVYLIIIAVCFRQVCWDRLKLANTST